MMTQGPYCKKNEYYWVKYSIYLCWEFGFEDFCKLRHVMEHYLDDNASIVQLLLEHFANHIISL